MSRLVQTIMKQEMVAAGDNAQTTGVRGNRIQIEGHVYAREGNAAITMPSRIADEEMTS